MFEFEVLIPDHFQCLFNGWPVPPVSPQIEKANDALLIHNNGAGPVNIFCMDGKGQWINAISCTHSTSPIEQVFGPESAPL